MASKQQNVYENVYVYEMYFILRYMILKYYMESCLEGSIIQYSLYFILKYLNLNCILYGYMESYLEWSIMQLSLHFILKYLDLKYGGLFGSAMQRLSFHFELSELKRHEMWRVRCTVKILFFMFKYLKYSPYGKFLKAPWKPLKLAFQIGGHPVLNPLPYWNIGWISGYWPF